MSTSKTKTQRAYVPATALAKSVAFDDDMLHVSLTDGRVISVPIRWYPLLREASPAQRQNYRIVGGGIGIHWPDIDEDLSVAGMMSGVDWKAA